MVPLAPAQTYYVQVYGYSSSSYTIIVVSNTPPSPSPTPSITQTPAPSPYAVGDVRLADAIGGSLAASSAHYYRFAHSTAGRAIWVTVVALSGDPHLGVSLQAPNATSFNATMVSQVVGSESLVVSPGDVAYPAVGAPLYVRVSVAVRRGCRSSARHRCAAVRTRHCPLLPAAGGHARSCQCHVPPQHHLHRAAAVAQRHAHCYSYTQPHHDTRLRRWQLQRQQQLHSR